LQSPLERLARGFSADVKDLLNRTVTNGVTLPTVLVARDRCVTGPGITKTDLRPKAVGLTIGRKPPTAYLRVIFTLEMDDEQRYLAATSSTVGVYADPDSKQMLCHYDYARNPTHGYPDPHFQVSGTSQALHTIGGQAPNATANLRDLHFPVGGRRFRPTLEDVIEFLILEGIAVARDGWDDAVKDHRRRWHEKQLRAATRRDPHAAVEALRELGYTVTPPP
jgi:hypothetical protein